MKTVPRISYARSADGVSLAFTVTGAGPALVFVPWVPFSNLQMEWQNPLLRGVFEQFAQRLTLVHYDGRGTGHSQRSRASGNPEQPNSGLPPPVHARGRLGIPPAFRGGDEGYALGTICLILTTSISCSSRPLKRSSRPGGDYRFRGHYRKRVGIRRQIWTASRAIRGRSRTASGRGRRARNCRRRCASASSDCPRSGRRRAG